MRNLATDLYQLTMGDAYLQAGMAHRRAVFHLTFRRAPFGGCFAVAAGLAEALDWLAGLTFGQKELTFLRSLKGEGDRPLLTDAFLHVLQQAPPGLGLDVDAVPEGMPVLPQTPLLRVEGPLWAAQYVETGLLSIVGFQTLVATKASRVVRAAEGGAVVEFGARRAQGMEAALAASRAAFVGGVDGTSHVRASALYGIPCKGTHAHAYVMAMGDEEAAFEHWVRTMPHNAVLLVDTYDVEEGIRRAIRAGLQLQADGGRLQGIRLDSGDLGAQSIMARQMLDEAGLRDTAIMASDELDEDRIAAMKAEGAAIDIWGVGTRLVTGGTTPAMGCVYKLGAVQEEEGWRYEVKLSETLEKSTIGGRLGVWRSGDGEELIDVLGDVDQPGPGEPLLRAYLREGKPQEGPDDVHVARQRCLRWMQTLPVAALALHDARPWLLEWTEHLKTRQEALLDAVREGR